LDSSNEQRNMCLVTNLSWEYVDLHPGTKVIISKWVYKVELK